jgi:hypothetical protein
MFERPVHSARVLPHDCMSIPFIKKARFLTDMIPAICAGRIGSAATKESGAEPALRPHLTVEGPG